MNTAFGYKLFNVYILILSMMTCSCSTNLQNNALSNHKIEKHQINNPKHMTKSKSEHLFMSARPAFKKAMSKNLYDDAVKMNNIGCNLENMGRYYEAVQYYFAAVNAGYNGAKYNLARAYASGRGIARDDAKAFSLYYDAAVAGITYAQHNLACAYLYGLGVNKDVNAARYWLEQSASKGTVESINLLHRLNAEQSAYRSPATSQKRKEKRKSRNTNNQNDKDTVKIPEIIDAPDKL